MNTRTCIGLSAAGVAACAGLARGQSFTEGFEGAVFPPADWFIHNQSNPIATPQWRLGTLNHSGAGSARDDYTCGSGTSTLSDWLIGRQMTTLQNGDSISFWTRSDGDAFPDRMQLRMSLAGASTNTGTTEFDVGDFGTLLLDINPGYTSGVFPTTAYGQFTVTISGVPVATAGRFAFRYFVEDGGPGGNNSFGVRVDDVAYIQGSTTGACCLATGGCQFIAASACATQGGTFAGPGVACAAANCAPGGSCCLTNETCSVQTAAACATAGGAWGGAGTSCTGSCSGACCFPDGTCSVVTGFSCIITSGATYFGNSTTCSAAPCRPISFQALPLAYNWNGMSSDASEQGESNRTDPAGYRSISDRGLLLNQPGSINSGPVLGTDSMPYTIPSAGHTLDIVHLGDRRTCDNANHNWNPPGTAVNCGAQPTWLTNNDQATIPQVSPMGALSATLSAQSRIGVIYQISNGGGRFDTRLTFTDNTSVTVTMRGPDWFAPFNPTTPPPTPGSGLIVQGKLGDYLATESEDVATSTTNNLIVSEAVFSVQQLRLDGYGDFTGKRIASIAFLNPVGNATPNGTSGATPATICGFAILGASLSFPAPGQACYANCDASTQPPVLNVADFSCFLQKFAAGDSYANCDASTQPPVLNVADFSCFLQKFAAGCSAP